MMHPVFFCLYHMEIRPFAVLFCIRLAFACVLNALQLLAQTVVSAHVLCALPMRVYAE